MIRSVCVAGAGSIGGLFAGFLGQVCEVSVLTRRAEQAEALERDGMRISGRADLVSRVRASTDPAELPQPDLVIVACKGTDLDALGARLSGSFGDAIVMTAQNGIGAEAIVGRHGDWPLVSSVTFMSGTRHSDTHVEYVLDTATWLGPYRDVDYATCEEIAELLRSSGLKAEAFADLKPAQWSKLIFNATVNAVAALTGLPHEARFAERELPSDLGHLVHDLIDEGKAVAAAAGVELGEDPWEMNLLATRRGFRHYPSMLEDVEARRPTEIELITGSLVREAERVGVPVPLHQALYRLIKAKEAGYS